MAADDGAEKLGGEQSSPETAGAEDPQVHYILHHPAHGLNRRQMVRRMLAGAGAAMALPAVASATPGAPNGRTYEYGPDLTTEMEQPRTGPWTPLFFEPHQNETYIVLAEHLVPGSTVAKVNEFVDLLLSVDSLEHQREVTNAISAFDAMAQGRWRRPYKDCPARAQVLMLTWASQAEPGERATHEPAWAATVRRDEEPAPRRVTLHDQFQTLKRWTSEAYYSSEAGKKSIGWTGQVYFSGYPGCQISARRQIGA